MKIIRAEFLGMCFGVRDAITLALHQARSAPLTILGDLVHNETVLNEIKRRGIQIVQNPGQITTRNVMVTAHGASNKSMNAVRSQGFRLTEATCPLVHVAHRAVARLVAEGFHPVIIGKRGHVEVQGLTEDLESFDVILEAEEVERLEERPRFGIAAQTTQPIEKVRALVDRIQQRFPRSEVRFVDTVCQPTKQRQRAAVELARRSSVVLVIGGAHSNNTQELVRTCGQFCARVHHIQGPSELRPEWFVPEDTVGVTAGTSTPDSVIAIVEERLEALARLLTPAGDPVPEYPEPLQAGSRRSESAAHLEAA